PGRRTFRRRGPPTLGTAMPPRRQYRVERPASLGDPPVAWLDQLGAAGRELAGGVGGAGGVARPFNRRPPPGPLGARPAGPRASVSTKAKNVRLITPFMVKNAASRRLRSPGRTSECS